MARDFALWCVFAAHVCGGDSGLAEGKRDEGHL